MPLPGGEEPEMSITLTGKIADFGRIDNVYTTLKREGMKLLREWKLEVNVTYHEEEAK